MFFLYWRPIEIQADELQASLAKAGIDMSDADLLQFIKAMDKDGDGAIDFEEWRDFLVVSTFSIHPNQKGNRLNGRSIMDFQ